MITILEADNSQEASDVVNKYMIEYTKMAARGACSWICSDCCVNFPEGMPDACVHGHDGCTKIIQRDKLESK